MTALLALLASAIWGSADFLGGSLSKRLPALSVTLVGQACALLAVLLVVPAVGGLHAPGAYLGWAVACGIIGPAALVAFYTALSVGTMGVVAPVAATGVVVPIVVGFARGERPALPQLLGIAAAVVGVVLASRVPASGGQGAGGGRAARPPGAAPRDRGGGRLRRGAGVRGRGQPHVGGHDAGLPAPDERRAPRRRRAAAGRRSRGPLLGLRRADLPLVALSGLADVSANGIYAVASTRGLVSVVAVLGSLYPVATVLLARQLLGERLARPQAAGVATALLGVVLMAAG